MDELYTYQVVKQSISSIKSTIIIMYNNVSDFNNYYYKLVHTKN